MLSALAALPMLLGTLPSAQSELAFDDLFPRKGYTGKTANRFAWSPDDRYLAYAWNPYDDRGFDLWLYDTREGKSRRLTSIEMMAAYDRDTLRAITQIKADKYEEEQSLKLDDMEYRKFVQDQKKKDEERKEPKPTYSGVGEFKWANKSNEILMTFKGDIFRWKLSEAKPTRLTRTRDAEAQVEYLPDDSGYTYRRGDGVYRVKFDNPMVEQLNPSLPNNLPLQAYSLSPDGTKLMLRTQRTLGPDRQVDWINYRGRFAQAQRATRAVADDKFNYESFIYLYDLNDDAMENPKNDGKPWEVWKFPGGDEFWEASINDNPWSPDSKKIVFAVSKRYQKSIEFMVADAEAKKTKLVYKTVHDGDHNTPGMTDPFWMPDSQRIVTMLETSGYRQAWMIDSATESASQITKGDFETYPLQATKDGKSLFVWSGKEHPARMNLYKVDVASGDYTRLSSQTGSYGRPEISKGETKMVFTFNSWSNLTESYVADAKPGGKETAITNSHRDGFMTNVNRLKPELFTYKNRHGQTVHGYMFLPPGAKKEDKRPLMIYVYGGPLGTGKSVVDGTFNSTAYLFNMYLTLKLGFVTVTIDPRGQSGYGSVFGKANYDQVGKPQVEDLTDGVKYLVENHGVDPKRVAINGWSFGGFQTQMCMYTAPDVFTLGIAGAGPTEWQNYNNWYTTATVAKGGPGKAEDIDKYSLTYLARNLKSPLMLLHGVEDTNVLYQDTIKVYRVLLQYGKGDLVELAIDPTGGHGMGGDMNNRDRHAIYLAFIKKNWRL